MLKRLAYLIAGSALLLLVAAMFWGFNRLNALTLAQQQTQRQITQWRDQPQHNNDYHELQAAVKILPDARKPLPCSLTMPPALRPNNFNPLTNRSRRWRDRSRP